MVKITSDEQKDTQYLEAVIEKDSDGSFTAIASTNAMDRHGEVVDNNGWDLKAYKKNPVILWGHDHSEPAIGTAKKVWIDGIGKKAKLMIQPVLHDVTNRAREIKELVDRGIIKTLSVGFKPLESPDGITFTKNELLEVSMVNVPANAEAMTLAYKHLRSKGYEGEIIKDLGMDTELIDKIIVMEKDIENLKSLVKMHPHQSKKRTEERLSMLKIIAKTSDKLLEADKKKVKVDKKNLVKVIKRATEIMTVAEKGNLRG